MSNSIELAYQQATAKKVNIKGCKECKFFALINSNPVCSFDSINHEECSLLMKELNQIT